MAAISIVIPVYNCAEYLRECLDSILTQSFKDIEVYCVDDESTDMSVDILTEYQQNDTRIHILQQKNSGQGVARNNALQYVTGKYVIFVDSDDWLEPDALQLMYDKMEKDGSEILLFNVYEVGADNKKQVYKPADAFFSKFGELVFSPIEAKDFIYNTTPRPFRMYKRDSMIKYGYKYAAHRHLEDHSPFFCFFASVDKMSVLNKCLYNYRLRENSSTRTVERCINAFYEDFLLCEKALKNTKNGEAFFEQFVLRKIRNFFYHYKHITPCAKSRFYKVMQKTFKYIHKNIGDSVVSKSEYFTQYKSVLKMPYFVFKYQDKIKKTCLAIKQSIAV